MLQSIRDKSQSWISIVIVLFLIVMFAMWGISYYLSDSVSSKRTVLKVNDKPVTINDYREVYNQLRQSDAAKINAGEVTIPMLKQKALESIVLQSALYQAADHAGFGVSDQDIDSYIAALPFLQQDGAFSQDLYKRYLQSIGLTTEGLRIKLRKSLLIDQWRIGLVSSEFVLPAEVQSYLSVMDQVRHINYVAVNKADFSPKQPTDQQIQSYYDQHKSQFIDKEKVKIAYLSLEMAPIKKSVTVTASEVKDYYDENQAVYTTPASRHAAMILVPEAKLAAVQKALKSGQSFAAVAKQYSADPVSAKNGGDIGWISATNPDKTLTSALFSLKKVGDVSSPLKTRFGEQIVTLLAEKPAVVKPFSDVEQQVKSHLIDLKAQKKYADIGNQLANLTFENPSSLQPAAKQLGLTVHTTDWLDRTGAKTGIASHKQIIKAAFSDEVLLQKNNSDPINLSDEHVIVLRDQAHQAAHLKPLADVKAQIVAALKLQSQADQAKAKADTILTDVNKSGKLSGASSMSVSLGKHTNPAIEKAVFNMFLPSKGHPVNSVVKTDKGYWVVSFDKVTMTSNKKQPDTATIKQFLTGLYASSDYEQYVNAVKDAAKVDYNAKVKESL